MMINCSLMIIDYGYGYCGNAYGMFMVNIGYYRLFLNDY